MNGSYSAAFLNSRNLDTTFQHASEVAVLSFALGPILSSDRLRPASQMA